MIKFIVIFIFLCALPVSESQAQNSGLEMVFSIEGSYFQPRRSKFKDFYGSSTLAAGVRFDFNLNQKFGISLRGRHFNMSKFEELDFSNTSIGILLKSNVYSTNAVGIYIAAGTQYEIRRVDFPEIIVLNPQISASEQTEKTNSLVIETGVDVWASKRIRVSPAVSYTYFPFGDTTRGEFGDTGGFFFVIGLGLKL